MSLEERSPKRQRRSYSPASPPETTKPAFVAQPPQTPPTSVHLHMSVSPSWQSQQSVAKSVTFPTPPSTAGFHTQMSGRTGSSEGGMESGRATPVDVNGQNSGDGDVEMGGSVDAGHRRTDHDRQAPSGQAGGADAESATKVGEGNEAPSAPPALYKLFSKPIAARRPQPSEDLLSLYDLREIQASVARKDPLTGEKINKLRKSYEGKIKTLGIDGRNKATAKPGELFGMVEAGWDQEVAPGRTMWDEKIETIKLGGPSTSDLFRQLGAALSMKPGRLPKAEHDQWTQAVGLDDKPAPTVTGIAAATGTKNTAQSFLAKTAPATAVRSSAPSSPRNVAGRPERVGKKRRYDESSYTGYHEGYDDDGYSTGGLDERRAGGGAKRQKRTDFASAAPSPSFSNNSARNSMVGVRSS